MGSTRQQVAVSPAGPESQQHPCSWQMARPAPTGIPAQRAQVGMQSAEGSEPGPRSCTRPQSLTTLFHEGAALHSCHGCLTAAAWRGHRDAVTSPTWPSSATATEGQGRNGQALARALGAEEGWRRAGPQQTGAPWGPPLPCRALTQQWSAGGGTCPCAAQCWHSPAPTGCSASPSAPGRPQRAEPGSCSSAAGRPPPGQGGRAALRVAGTPLCWEQCPSARPES